ncbi:uncharacterized protein K444DRAFT_606440 [Hyaloscypha bicolor E]|uniref:Uncharacterized protein n=1 Tax=Hyaloscypha bicolor E TaxID=1095630 RepID=A0A2J6TWW0_9HELO|nr:uncharacterized protein K444DRAFT_606440 [Hyaloscypha bicolor E]PMD67503.1 hypothetical protein K444DRAFT_606440 [Hyaloscypha bicolor E]
MTTTSASLGRLLPLEAVDLGRLVLDISEPAQDFYEAKSLPPPELKQEVLNFSEVLGQSQGFKLHGDLTSILTAKATSQRTSTSLVKSLKCVTRQLVNSGDYFRTLCRVPKARDFLERAIRQKLPVFLVTGIEAVIDSTVVQTGGHQREVAVDVTVPVAAAAAAAGAPIPVLGDLIDPGAGRSQNRQVDAGNELYAPGEQIYRVQYRKIEFSFFSRRKVDNAWLENGNRWKAYVGLRGTDGDAEDDGIEATLSEVQEAGI